MAGKTNREGMTLTGTCQGCGKAKLEQHGLIVTHASAFRGSYASCHGSGKVCVERAVHRGYRSKSRSVARGRSSSSSFAEKLYETRLLRERVSVDFLPLFDHLLSLARSSHAHGQPQRAGRELLQARKLTRHGTTPRAEDYANFRQRRGIGMFSKRVTSNSSGARSRSRGKKASRKRRRTRKT